MTRIFISYSRKDEEFARRLATDLEKLGADVWIDVDDIPAGMNWSTAIQQGLDTCDVIIVVISPDSMASSNVADEWQAFHDDKKPIIPVLWRPVKRVHFQLRRIQYIDFHAKDYDFAFKQLHKALWKKGFRLEPLSVLGREAQVAEPKSTPVRDEAVLYPEARNSEWESSPIKPKSFRRSCVTVSVMTFLAVIAVVAVILSGVLVGGDGSDDPNDLIAVVTVASTTPAGTEGPIPTRDAGATLSAAIAQT